MKSIFLTALVLSLGLAGCAFPKDPGQNRDKAPSSETVEAQLKELVYTGELNEKSVQFEFLENTYPGLYTLSITWPKAVPSMKVSLNGSPYTVISANNNFTKVVLYNYSIDVHIIALNSLGEESSSLSAQLISPKDLIISSAKEIHQDTLISVNRLYLNENGRIITNGHNLTVVTQKLFIENKIFDNETRMHTRDAQIITTSPGRTIPSLAFLSGPRIKIEANKAYGHLRIAMVGFDGINGGDGQNGSRGGSPGNLSVIAQDSSEFSLEVAQRKGAPGLGGKDGEKGSEALLDYIDTNVKNFRSYEIE